MAMPDDLAGFGAGPVPEPPARLELVADRDGPPPNVAEDLG